MSGLQHRALASIHRFGVMPLVALDDPALALPLADALIAGGLPLLEVAFRTRTAPDAIAAIRRERPDFLVGAGTILTPDDARTAAQAGAAFALAPGFNPAVAEAALAAKLPFIPGVCTPTEVEAAMAEGFRLLKLFPAGAIGGIDLLDALAGPYQHTGVRLIPTGGVNAGTLGQYLAHPFVAAAAGSWLIRPDDIAAARWSTITERCRAASQTVQRARNHTP